MWRTCYLRAPSARLGRLRPCRARGTPRVPHPAILTESVLLAPAGGALGALLAAGTLQGFGLGPSSVPRLGEIAVEPGSCFSLRLSRRRNLFGLAPAFASRPHLDGVLKSMPSLWGRGRPARLLVVGELALSVILLIGAGC